MESARLFLCVFVCILAHFCVFSPSLNSSDVRFFCHMFLFLQIFSHSLNSGDKRFCFLCSLSVKFSCSLNSGDEHFCFLRSFSVKFSCSLNSGDECFNFLCSFCLKLSFALYSHDIHFFSLIYSLIFSFFCNFLIFSWVSLSDASVL